MIENKRILIIYDIDDTLFESLINFYRVYELIALKTYYKTSKNKKEYFNPDLELCKEKLQKEYIYKNFVDFLNLKHLYNYLKKNIGEINRDIINNTKRKKQNPYLKEEYFLALEKSRDTLYLPLNMKELNVLKEIGFSDFLKPTQVYFDFFRFAKNFSNVDFSIVSKGSYEVQCKKIENYPLKDYFNTNNVQILREKDYHNWKDVVEFYSKKYHKIIAIGNSLNDDIFPVKQLKKDYNVECIWFKSLDFFTSKEDYIKSNNVETYSIKNLEKKLYSEENYKKIF